MFSIFNQKTSLPKVILNFEYSVTSNTHNKTTHSVKLYCCGPVPTCLICLYLSRRWHCCSHPVEISFLLLWYSFLWIDWWSCKRERYKEWKRSREKKPKTVNVVVLRWRGTACSQHTKGWCNSELFQSWRIHKKTPFHVRLYYGVRFVCVHVCVHVHERFVWETTTCARLHL